MSALTDGRRSGDSGRLSRFMALPAIVALAALIVLAPAASAAPKGVAAFFGVPTVVGSPAGGPAGQFGASSPHGIAVNTSGAGPADPGDIYVVDTTNSRIQRFSALGEFERMWGKDVIKAGAQVNTNLGDVAEICTFAEDCKDGVGVVGTERGGEFITPVGIAVNQTNGNVYVVERHSPGARVQAFDGDGNFLWAIGKNVVKNGGAGDVPTTPIVVNERQSVTIQGPFDSGTFKFKPVTGGAFTLSFDPDGGGPAAEQTTAAIDYNATAAGVQSALEGLAAVAPGDVAVSGGPGPSTAWTIEFTGALGGIDHQQMTADTSGLQPAGSSAFMGTAQNGGTTFEGGAEVCTVATDCRAAEIGSKGGEFGAGGLHTSNGGNGIAVVPAGLPNAGNVLVTDRGNRRVQEFTAAGAFVRAFGADVVPKGGAGNVANDEQQTVTVAASGGSFKLTFNSQSTVALPHNAPATDPGTPGTIDSVEEALNDLTSIKPSGSVSVSGGPGDTTGTSPYEVTFGGSLADLDVAQMTVNSSELLPGPGRTLNCAGGPASDVTLSYQWLANGAPAPGAGATTPNYTIDPSDAGKALQCRVTAVNSPSGNTGATTVSTPLTVVTASGPLPTPPAGNLSFTGNATLGSTLTCSAGAWGNAPTSYTYTWLRNGAQVLESETKAATEDTYAIAAADVASAANFQCMVTAANANGSAVKVSANKPTPSSPNPPGAPSPGAPSASASLAPLAATAMALQGASSFEICAVAAECKAGSAGDRPGQFAGTSANSSSPNRVAVDSSGDIYVVENSANFRLQKLTPSGPGLTPSIVNPDVGAGGPALPLSGTGASTTPLDVAVGPDDRLFVLKGYATGSGNPTAPSSERRVVELDSSGAYLETHGSRSGLNAPGFLALNNDSEEIYLTNTRVYVLAPSSLPTASLEVSSVGIHSAQLAGLVNPGGPDTAIGIRTKYRFEYRKAGAASWTVLGPDKDAGNGFADVPVFAGLSELQADTAYEAKLVASKPFSGVEAIEAIEAFTTPASPPDVNAYATEREAASATLNARIDPNGSATTYQFEYGPSAAYGTKVPALPASAGSGHGGQIFSEAITGLNPETTYHFRVVATNANGSAESADRTFTTRPAVQEPEGRGYELVSPPDKAGGAGVGNWYAGIGSHASAGIAAYAGDRYIPYTFYGATLADGGFAYGSDATFAERTPSGWVNKPAFNRPGGIGAPEFAKLPSPAAASEDLGLTAWVANSQMAIFPEQREAWGDLIAVGGADALREWDTGKWEIMAPLSPEQSSGTTLGRAVAAEGGYAVMSGGLVGVAGPTDPTAAPCTMSCLHNVYINDVTAGLSDSFPGEGIRSLVNACSGEGAARTAIPSVGGDGKLVAAECPPPPAGRDARPISAGGASLAAFGTGPGTISADGSRVFFMAPDHTSSLQLSPCTGSGAVASSCPPQVYVRQRNEDGSVTVRWISRSAIPGQDASLLAPAVFEGATPDGDKAFFRTASPLTADDPNGSGAQTAGGVKTGTADPDSTDLYMYDFPDDPGADIGAGTLTRVSAGPSGASDANASPGPIPAVVSSLRALGEDGRRAYFVTRAPLAGVAAATSGTITAPGAAGSGQHLYLYDDGLPSGQRWRFITRLPEASTFGSCAARNSIQAGRPLFQSSNGIGGGFQLSSNDPSCVRASADGAFLVLFTDGRLTADDPDEVSGDLYAYDAVTDELTRISAPQGGAGGAYTCVTPTAAAGAQCHGDPGTYSVGTRAMPPLNLATHPADPGDRTAFFESASRLVPEDENDVYDVYQWQNGELSLISTGAPGAEPALYRGNDRSGRNVYISTRDRLTWEDTDGVLDVYSAHLGGGFPEPPRPPACDVLGDGCQGNPISAPAPSGASSTAFEGAGNVVEKPKRKRCAKGKVRRRGKCVAKKGKRAHKRHRRAANKNRRAAK